MNDTPPSETHQRRVSQDALETVLPSSHNAPAAARRLVAEWLAADPADDPVRNDVILAASEVVTNAVRHAAQSEGSDLGLRLQRRANGVRVSVHQGAASGYLPVASFPATDETEGRGLAIVTSIADRWGVSHDSGLTVWFEMDHPTP